MQRKKQCLKKTRYPKGCRVFLLGEGLLEWISQPEDDR